jgi:metal-responsive CopG/Arc/MetJ family transcriptional regulator
MGRPPTGVDPMFSVRLPPELIKRVDGYAEQNGESRSQAIRELLEAGLAYRAAASGKPKPAPKRTKRSEIK